MQSPPLLTPGPPGKRKLRIPLWLFLVAIVLISAALYIIPHLLRNSHPYISLRDGRQMPPESRPKQTLPDGTQIWLNDNSEISYMNDLKTPNRRELKLEGEAYLIISKDTHPFIVHTPTMDVKANGATLDINAYEDDKTAEASVFGDSASVTLGDDPSKKFGLRSGQKLIVRKADKTNGQSQPLAALDTVHYQREDSLYIESAWVKFRLAMFDTNLEELAPRLQRLYGMKFSITGDQLKKQRFSIVIPTYDVEMTLTVLQAIEPFHYTIDKKEIHIQP